MDRLPSRDGYKTPAEILDYSFTWETWLNGDSISSSVWTPETGVTVASSSYDGQATTVWLDGGTINEKYRVVNKVVTISGRTAERTLNIHIVKNR